MGRATKIYIRPGPARPRVWHPAEGGRDGRERRVAGPGSDGLHHRAAVRGALALCAGPDQVLDAERVPTGQARQHDGAVALRTVPAGARGNAVGRLAGDEDPVSGTRGHLVLHALRFGRAALVRVAPPLLLLSSPILIGA